MKTMVGDNIKSENANWRFDEEVCKNFDQHVLKSIPLYRKGHELIVQVSDFFLRDDSLCYDLGCSTGQLLYQLAHHTEGRSTMFIGVDCEKEMLKEAEKKRGVSERISFHHEDILDVALEPADLIVCYYTIQFVSPKNRQVLFNRIYEALNWGGGFILFEKVRAPDARFQDMMTVIYMDFKLDEGYTPEEIVGKARSLKGVLEPFSTQGNLDLLKRAGFVDCMTIMKYVCFEGILAIK